MQCRQVQPTGWHLAELLCRCHISWQEVQHNASAASPAGALHGLVPGVAALQAPLALLNVLAEGVALALSDLPLQPLLLLTHFGGVSAGQ